METFFLVIHSSWIETYLKVLNFAVPVLNGIVKPLPSCIWRIHTYIVKQDLEMIDTQLGNLQ